VAGPCVHGNELLGTELSCSFGLCFDCIGNNVLICVFVMLSISNHVGGSACSKCLILII